MNIYEIWQEVNTNWDTYDSAIVAAESEEAARFMHPDNDYKWAGTNWTLSTYVGGGDRSWTHPDNVKVELVGYSNSDESKVLLASFNAG